MANSNENSLNAPLLNPDFNPTYLTLKLPHQSNQLVLQFYFKIPTLCYIFFPQWYNDFRNDN